MYDLFVCIIQILFEYCSTDIVPEVRFVIRISVGVAAVTFVISRYYIGTVINRSIRIDVVFRFSFCKNSDAAVILYWFWTLVGICCSWHTVHCSDFDFVGLKLLIRLDYPPWQLAVWINLFTSVSHEHSTFRRIKRNIFWDFFLSVRKKRPLAMPLHGKVNSVT